MTAFLVRLLLIFSHSVYIFYLKKTLEDIFKRCIFLEAREIYSLPRIGSQKKKKKGGGRGDN